MRSGCADGSRRGRALEEVELLRYRNSAMAKKRRAASRADMVMTTVAFPPGLYRRLAIAALDEHAAIAELIREAVAEWMRRREAGRRKGRTP